MATHHSWYLPVLLGPLWCGLCGIAYSWLPVSGCISIFGIRRFGRGPQRSLRWSFAALTPPGRLSHRLDLIFSSLWGWPLFFWTPKLLGGEVLGRFRTAWQALTLADAVEFFSYGQARDNFAQQNSHHLRNSLPHGLPAGCPQSQDAFTRTVGKPGPPAPWMVIPYDAPWVPWLGFGPSRRC